MGSQALTASSLLARCHLCASSPGWAPATVAARGTERPSHDQGDGERPQGWGGRGVCVLRPQSSSCQEPPSCGAATSAWATSWIVNRAIALCTQPSVWQSLCTLCAILNVREPRHDWLSWAGFYLFLFCLQDEHLSPSNKSPRHAHFSKMTTVSGTE